MIKNNIKSHILNFLTNYKEPYESAIIYYLKDIIITTLKYINEILENYPNVKLLYSVKANYNFEILKLLSSYVSGYDVASKAELQKVIRYIPHLKYISASGYAFSKTDLIEAYELGVAIDFMSLTQIRNIIQHLNNIRRIGIRINVPQKNGIIGNKTHFGINYEMTGKQLKELCVKEDLIIDRLHLHDGIKKIDSLKIEGDEIEKWINLFQHVSHVNLGGGWDYLIDKNEFSDALAYITKRFPNITFYIEPGSLLVRKSGILVTQVIDLQCIDENLETIVLDTSAFNLSSWFHP